MNRRNVLQLVRSLSAVAATGALPVAAGIAMSRPARAEDWPTKNIHVIVPYGAGSATDLIPRTIFEAVSARLGQTVIVENRLGGGTTVGASAVARAEPDGYTILVHSNAIVTVPAIQANVPYDPVRDFAAITPLANVPLVLVIAPEKNVKSVQELIALAKQKAGTINYAAAGIGTPPHLTAERFRLAAGFQGQVVPFKGAPEALTEVLTGRVDFYFCPLPVALPFIRDGKLLALAVGGSKRAAALPDVPTTLEAGVPNSDFDFWVGAFVPKQTSRDIVAKLHRETVAAIESAAIHDKLAKFGVEPMVMTPEDFDARIAREAGIAVALAKAANITSQ
ncbi:MAG TPA: tripartite tricarboxylate transporter substrate-binding protein [Xanthobacteraceae bacterium]